MSISDFFAAKLHIIYSLSKLIRPHIAKPRVEPETKCRRYNHAVGMPPCFPSGSDMKNTSIEKHYAPPLIFPVKRECERHN